MLTQEDLILTSEEQDSFNEFLSSHANCGDDESLSNVFNVKLVYNIKYDGTDLHTVVTCLCSACGEEDLVSDYYSNITDE